MFLYLPLLRKLPGVYQLFDSGTQRSSLLNKCLRIRAANRIAKECTIRSFLRAKGEPGSRGRKSYSAKLLVGPCGLVRLRPLVPRAGQLLDLSCGARPRALDGSDARVLWKAPYRRNSYSLGDVRIVTHFFLFVYALPAWPAFVRAGCKTLDDRGRTPVHPPGSIHRLGAFWQLRRSLHVNLAVASGSSVDGAHTNKQSQWTPRRIVVSCSVGGANCLPAL